ncbi:hypothetical protein [Maribacter ulvicola]|uniref:Uncharacterized protein n=1 Tax=Maribacter ulvicola TaxID=228959 RepID=A0A1N6PS87_9FLAO|nr:hypothetical protein [Maribacter ulvicola]SIQ07146.1 hypothetical protein SAMN05421797_101573 [Maribacter ulvicola]
MRTHINGFKKGRMKLFSFLAEKGQYKINLIDDSSNSKNEELHADLIPANT